MEKELRLQHRASANRKRPRSPFRNADIDLPPWPKRRRIDLNNNQCIARTKKKERCRNHCTAHLRSTHCHVHRSAFLRNFVRKKLVQCSETTIKGRRCKNLYSLQKPYCTVHTVPPPTRRPWSSIANYELQQLYNTLTDVAQLDNQPRDVLERIAEFGVGAVKQCSTVRCGLDIFISATHQQNEVVNVYLDLAKGTRYFYDKPTGKAYCEKCMRYLSTCPLCEGFSVPGKDYMARCQFCCCSYWPVYIVPRHQ